VSEDPTKTGSGERRPSFTTSSGIPVKRAYTEADRASASEARDLGLPGAPPFTRGVQPTMYRSRLWTMRQYSGFGTAVQTNERFRYLLEQGQSGLSVAFDLPTQMGYDSDHPQAAGEVGKVGVAISSLDDMGELLAGIPLDKVSTSMTINATASILLAFYVAVAKRQGIDPAAISGTIQNDLLKEYIARGTYIYPPEPSLRITTDLFAWCAEHTPRWNTISISGYHMREAGATAVQEVAFTLANAIAYCEAAIARGLPFASFAGRLSFFFNGHANFFEEAAKFRAARRLWSRIVRARFGAEDPELGKLRFTRKPRDRRSRRSSPRSTWSARRCRRSPRSWEGPSPCTRTRWTRRWGFRPKTPRFSRCARNRSSPTKPASRTRSIRSRGRTSWNR